MKFAISPSRPCLFRSVFQKALILLLGVLVVSQVVTFAWTNRRSSQPKSRSRHAGQKGRPGQRFKEQKPKIGESALEYSIDAGEDVEGRQNWFMFQRTYPFGSIPPDARRRAWENRPVRGKGTFQIEAQTWTPIGPMPTRSYAPLFANFGLNSGRINSIAVSPANPQLILVGGSTGGLWRSTDGGATFTAVSDSQVDLAVGSIAFSPSNPNIVYAGMGDMHDCCTYLGSGILKSVNAGLTWTHINNATLPQPGAVGRIAVDPNNPNKVYVALYRSLDPSAANSFPFGGIYVSSDGGVNWTLTLQGLPRDLAINPANPQIIYAAMRGIGTNPNPGGGGLYRSLDGASSWSSSPVYASTFGLPFSNGGLRDIRVTVSPTNSQKVYVYSGNGSSSSSSIRLAFSTDGGATFPTDNVLTTVDKGQFGYNTYLEADPFTTDTIYIGSRDVYKSTNAGGSWVNITKNFTSTFIYNPSAAKAHPDQHSLAFSTSGNSFYIGNDGGIYKTTDGGTSFQSLNATLSLTQFISIARHPNDTAITYGGTQDNGTQKRQGAASSQWEDFASGDGGHVVIDPLDPSTLFTTYIYGNISRWRNNGATNDFDTSNSTFGEPTTNPRIAFYPPFTGNGVDSRLYFGTWKLFVSTDLGATWNAPGGTTDLTTGGTDVLSAIGVSQSNPNVIYTGSELGQVMVSTNGGQTWSNANAGLPIRFIASINVDYSNPAIAYLTVSGFGSGHVFKTTNTGASWTDISGAAGQGGMPNIPTSALLIDPGNPNVLYAGTDVGVFRSTTGGNTWNTFSDGMPPVVVMAFSANTAGRIQVATYGRGAYEAAVAINDFSLSTDTASNSILLGTSASYQINTATVSGNPQTVNLSVSGVPANTAYSLTPAAVISGSSATLQIDTNSFTPTGTYTLTINGTGSTSHSTSVTLTVSQPAPNIIDDARTFVRQHYLDFLGREPDQIGWDYWTSQITGCGSDIRCIHNKRIDVSAAFFVEAEFQRTGSFVVRLYKGGLGRQPNFAEFTADRSQVHEGPNLEATKQALALAFVQRAEFVQKYAGKTTASLFVDALIANIQQNSNVDLSSQRAALISKYNTGADMNQSRAFATRDAIDNAAFVNAEYNRSFVLMQYFGYLVRNIDQNGYQFWLDVLNNRVPGNFRAMVCAFITSDEYQHRFGSSVTRTNRDCGP